MSSNAAQFDVDDSASAQLDCGAGMAGMVDAFVKADGGPDLRLYLRMRMDVIPFQRLLNHEKLKVIECPQMVRICQTVCRIRIHREHNIWESVSNCRDEVDVLARLDL